MSGERVHSGELSMENVYKVLETLQQSKIAQHAVENLKGLEPDKPKRDIILFLTHGVKPEENIMSVVSAHGGKGGKEPATTRFIQGIDNLDFMDPKSGLTEVAGLSAEEVAYLQTNTRLAVEIQHDFVHPTLMNEQTGTAAISAVILHPKSLTMHGDFGFAIKNAPNVKIFFDECGKIYRNKVHEVQAATSSPSMGRLH